MRGRQLRPPDQSWGLFAKGGDAEDIMPHLIHPQGNSHPVIPNSQHATCETQLAFPGIQCALT